MSAELFASPFNLIGEIDPTPELQRQADERESARAAAEEQERSQGRLFDMEAA